ncbi:MAG: O-antigen ligase family protein [Leptolyngbyaceae cyanobacterium]
MFIQEVARPVFDAAKTELFEKLEKVFIIVFLILYSRGIVALVLTGGASEGDGSGDFDFGILTLFWMANYVITACLFVVKWDIVKDRLMTIIFSNYFYWIFLMFIMLSTIWSERPDETFRASIGMIGTVMFGAYIVSRYKLQEQIKLLVLFFGVVIGLSVLMVFVPGYGIDHGKHAGAIRGIYTHKNIFGPIVTLSCATFLIYLKSSFCEHKKLAYLGFLASFALVVGSRSSSSLLYTVLLVILIHAVEVLRLSGKLFAWALGGFAALYFFVSTWWRSIFVYVLGLLGRDATLTGRTDIWDVIIGKIQERLWFGYGFDGFWHGIYGESLYVRNALRWDLPNSHNGFLDLMLGVGIIGFALLSLAIWVTFIKNIAVLRNRYAWVYTWPLVYIFYMLMINMSESSLATQNTIQAILMTICIASTSLEFNDLFREEAQPDLGSSIDV